MALNDLAAAARKSGLRVVELPGWKKRGRPASSGGFNPRGVLCHHTGGESDGRDYVEWMAYQGRADLPAPLCQLALSRSGIVYVVAGGRANHGGTAKKTGPMPAGDANYLYVGIEAMNTGSEGWGTKGEDAAGNTITQGEAYARLCAALCDHYGWPASHVRAHRETSVTGKWDPGGLDMDTFRARVADLIPTIGEDDMPAYKNWPKEDRDALVTDVADAVVKKLLETDLYPQQNKVDQTVRQALKGKKPERG